MKQYVINISLIWQPYQNHRSESTKSACRPHLEDQNKQEKIDSLQFQRWKHQLDSLKSSPYNLMFQNWAVIKAMTLEYTKFHQLLGCNQVLKAPQLHVVAILNFWWWHTPSKQRSILTRASNYCQSQIADNCSWLSHDLYRSLSFQHLMQKVYSIKKHPIHLGHQSQLLCNSMSHAKVTNHSLNLMTGRISFKHAEGISMKINPLT